LVNTTLQEHNFIIPQDFIDGNYLPQSYLDTLTQNASNQYVVTISDKAPKLGGGFETVTSAYFFIEASGTLTVLGMDLSGLLWFKMSLATDLTFKLELLAAVEVDIKVAQVAVIGVLEFQTNPLDPTRTEILGGLTVSAGLDLGSMLIVDADATITFNSTTESRSYTFDLNGTPTTFNIPEGPGVRFSLGGSITFQPAGVQLLKITGVFILSVDTDGLSIFVDASAQIGPSSFRVSAAVTGVLFVTSTGGVAMDFHASVGANAFGSFMSLSVKVRVVLNYTGQEQTLRLYDQDLQHLSEEYLDTLEERSDGYYAVISKGVPLFDGTEGGINYFALEMRGDVTIGSFFTFGGYFFLSVSQSSVQLKFNAFLDLNPFGGLRAGGELSISTSGLSGSLELEGSLGGFGVELSGKFTFSVNTAAGTLSVGLQGRLVVAGAFKVEGSFILKASASEFTVSVDAKFDFMGIVELDVDGFFGLYRTSNPGIVLDIGISASVSLVPGIVSIELDDARLQLNTRSIATTTTAGNVIPSYFLKLKIDNAGLRLIDTFDLVSMSGFLEVNNGSFALGLKGRIDFFVLNLEAELYFNSEGEFKVGISGGASLNLGPVTASLTAYVTVSYLDSNGEELFGDGDKQLEISGGFHLSFSLGIDFPWPVGWVGFSFNAGIDLKVTGSSFKITIRTPSPLPNINFTLGSSPDQPDTPELGSVSGGVLTL